VYRRLLTDFAKAGSFFSSFSENFGQHKISHLNESAYNETGIEYDNTFAKILNGDHEYYIWWLN